MRVVSFAIRRSYAYGALSRSRSASGASAASSAGRPARHYRETMGVIGVPFASQSFVQTSWIFVFAIPPILVCVFLGGYQPRTRRSLVRLGLAEAATGAFVGGCIVLRYFELAATDAIMGPFILLGVLGWPAAFLGAVGRVLHDSRRDAPVS